MEDVKIAAQCTLIFCAFLLVIGGLLVLAFFLANNAPWMLAVFIPLGIFLGFLSYIKLQS